MDLDALLSAREGDGVSGENLEYDLDFMELQRLSQPGEERQAGNQILAGEEPDFADVEKRALTVLERAHDIRAAVILADARLNTKGIPGFADAVAYIRRCLAERWDTCFPELDPDDDNDPTMRINAVRGLAGAETTLRYLRRTPLTQSRTFGRANLLQIQQAYGEMPVPDGARPEFDRASIAAAFADSDPGQLATTLDAARRALADVTAIDKQITGVINSGGYPVEFKFAELQRIMQQIVRHLGEHVAGEEAVTPEDAAPDLDAASPAEVAPTRRATGGPPGAVETAQDARDALDRVIGYFRRQEPSSPVPILLERAKRLVGADFLSIMKDMAPKGLDTVRMIGGLPDDD